MAGMDITVVNHPLAASRLTIMRDKRSNNAAFRAALADLGAMLIYEAARDLELEEFDTETPVATARARAWPPRRLSCRSSARAWAWWTRRCP